jgi:hypothetical protein
VLIRAFAKRSEKIGKMPWIAWPLRADRVVTRRSSSPAPLKKCPVCKGTSFRSVGTGKPSESYVYVPGYFRRLVTEREAAHVELLGDARAFGAALDARGAREDARSAAERDERDRPFLAEPEERSQVLLFGGWKTQSGAAAKSPAKPRTRSR